MEASDLADEAMSAIEKAKREEEKAEEMKAESIQ